MRILWSANAPWATTGYGVQSKHILPRLQALGHEVGVFAWYGLQGGKMDASGVPVYPAGYDQYGNDILPAHCADFAADLFVTLIDLWVQDPALGQRASEECGRWVPWLAWFPIDSSPPYPGILERLPHVDYPVQYSQFGMAQAAAAGAPKCRYIPHGVDPTVFGPGDRAPGRTALQVPDDAWVCMMVAANKGYPSRKAFDIQLQAFARFQQRHPEAILYLHTQSGQQQGGLELGSICRTLDIPQETVRVVSQYQQHIGIPEQTLAMLYQAADCLLAATYAEGFGVPILEAQACGLPVITTRGTSMTELTHNGIATASRQKYWSQIGGWWDQPDVEAIDDALEELYQRSPEQRAAANTSGVEWAQTYYSWDVCVEQYWAPLLEEIARDIAVRRAGAVPDLAGVGA
jgi:glycosyltransferase involved in cell wall biosynthesis